VADVERDASSRRRFEVLLENGRVLAEAAAGTGWKPVLADPAFRSGILLLEAVARATRGAPLEELRTAFRARGIALTAYDGGVVRMSMPGRAWRGREVDRVRRALRACC
jgi:hypothetical protein